MGLTLAIVLPWLLGIVWLQWLWRQPRAGYQWALVMGYGYLLGMLLATVVMRLLDALGLGLEFWSVAFVLVALIGTGIILSWRIPWRIPWRSPEYGRTAELQVFWRRAVWILLLILILMRLGGLGAEILLRPLFPWDAWSTWAVKARVWFELKELVPFVEAAAWLAADGKGVYTLDAWHYPRTVSLIQSWMALGVGSWNEPLINLAWLGCGGALGLAFYGQARVWGVSPLLSLLFTYLLLSVPLLDTHVALAGYADLWLATAYSLGAMSLVQWIRNGDPRQGWLAILLVLAGPMIKLEGTVWLLTFIPALGVAFLPLNKLLWSLAALGASIAAWYVLGGFTIGIPGLEDIHLTPELIQIPYLGRFTLSFSLNWDPFIQNLFMLANWHLVWYLATVVIIFSIPRIAADRLLLSCSALVFAGLGMLFVLFFMTQARLWAEDYTSINRLFLHMLPVLLFYILILVNSISKEGFHTGRASSGPPV